MPVRAVIPLQTFRYAICGGVNLGLNWVLYAVLYNFILDKEIVRLGFVAISPYIAAFLVVFPITFVTGFWLQKHIAFKYSPLRGRTQLFRYLISVLGSVLLNYLLLKFFVEAVHLYPTPSQAVTSPADYRVQLPDAEIFYFPRLRKLIRSAFCFLARRCRGAISEMRVYPVRRGIEG